MSQTTFVFQTDDLTEVTRESAKETFYSIREQSSKNFPNGLSVAEINEEIYKARHGED